MGIAAPLADSDLFAATQFELRDPPGRVGRWVVRRVHGAEVDSRHLLVRADGQPLGLVRKARRRLAELLYSSRLEVVDPGGTVLLVLLSTSTSLSVRDAGGQLGVLRRRLAERRPPQPRVRLYSGPVGSEVEVAALAPRGEYARFGAPGVSLIVDPSGATAARVTGAGDFRHVAEISAGIDDALRVLVIAFTCSFADHHWLYWTRQGVY
ncbi:MAG TPA: hypothetical protein VL120_03880 [Solirubrobacteraceae bacterium]|jgi:hypothetical protein|nr:hypothetical protein [Solirubrobacteraceae bacterium]